MSRGYSDGLVLLDLLLPEPRIIEPEVQVKILQVALTGLVADRTVERVVGQEELQHRPAAVLSLLILGVHNHPFAHRRIAGDLELGKLLHVHEADAAVARDRESGVIAVARNEDPHLLRGLDDRGPSGDAYLTPVDAQLRHDTASMRRALRPVRMYVSNSFRNFAM